MFNINTFGVDAVTVMSNSVDDGVCQRAGIPSRLVIPFLELILGAENRG